ncbi:MAG: Hsp20/alpha crystallin family protein [Bacteroidales bacterium]|nr:Hsp20/alpha crystallin family protein [Bacteroidales bacterium]
MRHHNFYNKEAKMLQRFFNNDDIDWFGNNMFHADRNRMYGVPPVNISESDKEFAIEMAAPGYDKKDFNVSVDKNLLTISVDLEHGDNANTENTEGKANAEDTENPDNKQIYRQEFCFSSFSRSFTLPEGVDAQKIGGKYENGILTLSIPKAAVVNTKKSVEIK